MATQNLKLEFDEKGFVVLRGLLQKSDIEKYVQHLKELAGDRQKNWTLPDGLCKAKEFWSIITHPELVKAVREIFGSSASFLQHNDLHVGFSSPAWHRDSFNRNFGKYADWNEQEEPYRLMRCGIYLQDYDKSGFELGMIPGSHRPDIYLTNAIHQQVEKRLGKFNTLVQVLGKSDPIKEHSEWIATNPGDAVLFDPRTVHTGSHFTGSKFSIFAAFGVPNHHFHRHWHYYRHLRQDLGYQSISPDLVKHLETAGLYTPPQVFKGNIDGAWLPSKTVAWFSKQFKQ